MAKNKELCIDSWVDERLSTLEPATEWQPNSIRALGRLRQCTANRNRAGNWKWIGAVAVIAIIGVCLVALPTPRVFAHYCLDCSVALLQSLSKPASTRTELASEPDRKTAPDFTLADASGKQIKLSDLRGRVVLLNFWATWCHGCATEIPWFVEFQSEYKDRGLAVLGVSLDGDGWKSVKPYVAEKRMNYPVVIGDDNLATLYSATALPVTLLIDRNGKIAASHAGVISKDSYAAEIEKLLDSDSLPGEN